MAGGTTGKVSSRLGALSAVNSPPCKSMRMYLLVPAPIVKPASKVALTSAAAVPFTTSRPSLLSVASSEAKIVGAPTGVLVKSTACAPVESVAAIAAARIFFI